MRRDEFDDGARRPSHVSTTDAGFRYVEDPSQSLGLRRIDKERTGFVKPDEVLHTHQRRLVAGTLEYLREHKPKGYVPTPQVRVHPDGTKWVSDGHHRIAVARERGQRLRVNYIHMGPG